MEPRKEVSFSNFSSQSKPIGRHCVHIYAAFFSQFLADFDPSASCMQNPYFQGRVLLHLANPASSNGRG